MSEPLVFMMGLYEARIPTDRQYAANHMWAVPRDSGFRFGFSAYAVRLLQDVYFLDWVVDPEIELRQQQEIGSIESKKAESSLYAPIPGTLSAINTELLMDPSGINVDAYGTGWLFEIIGDGDGLMSPEAYVEYLKPAWEKAQRKLKVQFGDG